jgi:hypothetical protein
MKMDAAGYSYKRRQTSTRLYGVTTQKAVTLKF